MGTSNSWNNQIAAANSAIELNSGTNAINISTDAEATTVSVGTGAAVKTTLLGSTTASSTTTIQGPSAGVFALGVAGNTVSNLNYVTINTSTGALGSSATPIPVVLTNTWTPVLQFGGLSTGITYSLGQQWGSYYSIGNVVFYNLFIVLSSKGSATGAVTIAGLPFPPAASPNPAIWSSAAVLGGVTFDSGYTWAQGVVTGGGSALLVQEAGSGKANVNMYDTNFANNSVIQITGFYFM